MSYNENNIIWSKRYIRSLWKVHHQIKIIRRNQKRVNSLVTIITLMVLEMGN